MTEPIAHFAGLGLHGMLGQAVEAWTQPRVTWTPIRARLGNRDQLVAELGQLQVDAVVNYAARTDVQAASTERGDTTAPTFVVNAVGAKELAEACLETGKFLIHISTDYVFEGDARRPYLESDPPDAETDWYGKTKRVGEEWIAEVLPANQFAIVRVASPFQSYRTTKLDIVRKLIEALGAGRQLQLFCDTVFTPTFSTHHARQIVEIGQRRLPIIAHSACSTPLSPYELGLAVAECFDFDLSLITASSYSDYLANGGRPYPRMAALAVSETALALQIPSPSVGDALLALRDEMMMT